MEKRQVGYSFKNILDNRLIMLLLLLPFFEPGYIDEMEALVGGIYVFIGRTLSWWAIGSTLLIIFFSSLRRQMTRISLLILIYCGTVVFITLIVGGDLKRCLALLYTTVGLSLLCDLCIQEDTIESFVQVCFYIGFFLIAANLLCLFLFPDGMWTSYRGFKRNWLLGNYNEDIYLYIPCICFGTFWSYYKNKRLSLWVYATLAMSIVALVTVWSATSLVAIVIFTLLFIVREKKLPKVLNACIYYIGALFMTWSMVYLKIQEKFAFFINAILNKDLTFSGRMGIWKKAIMYIRDSIIIGNGIESKDVLLNKLGFLSSHNIYIDTLYIGGIVLLIIFSLICLLAGIKLYQNRNNVYSNVLSAALLAFYIVFLMTSRRNNPLFFVLIVMAFNVQDFIQKLSNQHS